jgi:hypothetical protein
MRHGVFDKLSVSLSSSLESAIGMAGGARKVTRRRVLKSVIGVATAGWAVPGSQNASTVASAQDMPVINYRVPRREYVAIKAGSLSVQVEKSLQTADKAVAKKAMDRLVKNVGKALETFPKPAADGLRDIRFFLMHGPQASGGGKTNGLEYIQASAPPYHPELDPRWGDSMVLYCARNYVDITDLWAIKAVVHEYGHAYQLRNWPEQQPDIMRAYKNAMKQRLYCNVKDVNGKTLDAAYATTNQLEYFAELTAIYFAGCNYQPFNRSELEEYDPVGYALVERFWRVREGASAKARAKTGKLSRRR